MDIYNINDYTIPELLTILDLDDPTTEEIKQATDEYINRSKKRPELVTFLQLVKEKLLEYMNDIELSKKDAEYKPNEEQTDNWIKYESLPQKNDTQKNKITDRAQKIDVYDNNHMPMKQQQLGINNNFNVPVAQDVLNPNLENITTRFINLDSQFRQASGGVESMSTDYTMDLSDPLTNVISLRLYSIQIPYTWYTIDYVYGNTCFWVTNQNNTFKIYVEPGNYSPAEFCNAIQVGFTLRTNFLEYSQAFTYGGLDPTNPPNIATFFSTNGKIILNLTDWYDPLGNQIITITQYSETFDSSMDAYFTFFDIMGGKSCYEEGTYVCSQGHSFNETLGWLMGFRLPIQPIFTDGNIPVAVLNLYGTKYFIVVLDDYNQNHINNGLITITELSKSVSLPSYYNTSQPYTCLTSESPLSLDVLGNFSNNPNDVTTENINNSLGDKIDIGLGKVPQILPSAPRTLTQAQIYTINEIMKNRNKTISFRAKAPTNSDTFALIPIKYGSLNTGQLYTELSGQFQDNKRVYFGPVDIERLRLKLLDDKGNVVDLHGADWSITLISENLYQY
jgi:hypothetical protein